MTDAQPVLLFLCLVLLFGGVLVVAVTRAETLTEKPCRHEFCRGLPDPECVGGLCRSHCVLHCGNRCAAAIASSVVLCAGYELRVSQRGTSWRWEVIDGHAAVDSGLAPSERRARLDAEKAVLQRLESLQ